MLDATAAADTDAVGRVCRFFVVLTALCLPWNAIQFESVPLADYPLIAALVTGIFASVVHRARPIRHLIVGAMAILLSGLITEVMPPTPAYLNSRILPESTINGGFANVVRSTANLPNLGKYEISLVLLPIAVVLGASSGRRSNQFLAKVAQSWVLGVSVSAAVALLDYLNVTHVSASLLGYESVDIRQAGLTNQPNTLGLQLAMSVPFALAAFRYSRRWRWAGFGVAVACALGVYLTGSRGSAVGLVVALVITLVVAPFARPWAARALFGLLAAFGFILLTPRGRDVLSAVRLTSGGTDVQSSDAARTLVREQALRDWMHAPLTGIGWGHANEAHLIYLQVAASGGLLGFVGFLIAVGGTCVRGFNARRAPVAAAALASVLTWLAVGLVENQVTDQWVYLPLTIVLGYWTASARREPVTESRGTRDSVSPRRPRPGPGRRLGPAGPDSSRRGVPGVPSGPGDSGGGPGGPGGPGAAGGPGATTPNGVRPGADDGSDGAASPRPRPRPRPNPRPVELLVTPHVG